eukprot:PLAT14836.2.p2 GENE.PLAT14836.2~~PLAT14836.2.p2  ORF type:complete len:222 (-),score=47.13 PLAT14836.2:42-707(-)
MDADDVNDVFNFLACLFCLAQCCAPDRKPGYVDIRTGAGRRRRAARRRDRRVARRVVRHMAGARATTVRAAPRASGRLPRPSASAYASARTGLIAGEHGRAGVPVGEPVVVVDSREVAVPIAYEPVVVVDDDADVVGRPHHDLAAPVDAAPAYGAPEPVYERPPAAAPGWEEPAAFEDSNNNNNNDNDDAAGGRRGGGDGGSAAHAHAPSAPPPYDYAGGL